MKEEKNGHNKEADIIPIKGGGRTIRVMRLRYVGAGDFRKSGRMQFEELVKKKPSLATLGAKDVVILRSFIGNQIRILEGFTGELGKTSRGNARKVFEYHQFTLEHGTWDDLMVADYALMRGIKLEGIPTMKEIFAKLIAQAHTVTGKGAPKKSKGALRAA